MAIKGGVLNQPGLPKLVSQMLQPDFYPHPVSQLELLETHISWVILTGDFVYKVKKPVDLGFLDFSSLEKRHKACEDELRLNARLAPELYLAVMPVTGTIDKPRLGGTGPALEYLLKMHEFPQDRQLDRLLTYGHEDAGQLLVAFQQFGERLAHFHDDLPPARDSTMFGDPETACAAALANFEHLDHLKAANGIRAQLTDLQDWTGRQCQDRRDALRARKQAGRIRECHGDLHLRNLVLLERGIVPFDCIEFSAELRWIDVISDVAFLFMDLLFHKRDELAYAFLNAWLSSSGDYEGLALLRFYAVYRAMVRAKIAGIELQQEDWPDSTEKPLQDEHLVDLRRHLALATRLHQGRGALLILTYGVSGSGKTWLASRLARQLGAIHIRSDVERKRLFGMAAEEHSSVTEKSRVYSWEASARTYARLLATATSALDAGMPVIVDATFLEKDRRDPFARLARKAGVNMIILHCLADSETLNNRVRSRQSEGSDASEADQAVLAAQLQSREPLAPDEQQGCIVVDTGQSIDIAELADRLTAQRP